MQFRIYPLKQWSNNDHHSMLVLLGFPNCQRTCLEGINVTPCGFTLGKNTSPNMLLANMVELRGIEPRTLCLQSRCSPSWAIAPYLSFSRYAALAFSFSRSCTCVHSLLLSSDALPTAKNPALKHGLLTQEICTGWMFVKAKSAPNEFQWANESSLTFKLDKFGGSGWIWTTDLTLIRGAL